MSWYYFKNRFDLMEPSERAEPHLENLELDYEILTSEAKISIAYNKKGLYLVHATNPF